MKVTAIKPLVETIEYYYRECGDYVPAWMGALHKKCEQQLRRYKQKTVIIIPEKDVERLEKLGYTEWFES